MKNKIIAFAALVEQQSTQRLVEKSFNWQPNLNNAKTHIHKGHFYGTVDTTADYFWGNYYPERLSTPLPKQKYSIPTLTFAPEPILAAAS
jgi:hypothetical protein